MPHKRATMSQSEKDAALKRKEPKTKARKAKHVAANTARAQISDEIAEANEIYGTHKKRKTNHGNGNPNRSSVLVRAHTRIGKPRRVAVLS